MTLAPVWYYFIVGNVFDFLYPSFFLPLHYFCCCNESYYRGWLSNHKTNHETKPGRKLMTCTPKDPTYFCYLVRPFYFPYHRAAQPIPLAVSMRQCKEKARHETKCLHPKSVNKKKFTPELIYPTSISHQMNRWLHMHETYIYGSYTHHLTNYYYSQLYGVNNQTLPL